MELTKPYEVIGFGAMEHFAPNLYLAYNPITRLRALRTRPFSTPNSFVAANDAWLWAPAAKVLAGDGRASSISGVQFAKPVRKLTCNHSVILISILFWPRPGNGIEMALALVSGADFSCVLHHFSSLTRWIGSRGQVGPGDDRSKPKLKFQCLIPGLIATQKIPRAGLETDRTRVDSLIDDFRLRLGP